MDITAEFVLNRCDPSPAPSPLSKALRMLTSTPGQSGPPLPSTSPGCRPHLSPVWRKENLSPAGDGRGALDNTLEGRRALDSTNGSNAFSADEDSDLDA